MATNTSPWRILVVDDEEGVHGITRMIFRGYQFDNRSIELISALNGQQAREILKSTDNIALILLDVVMESDDEGLRLVDYVRNTLGNHDTRIILRTGHPGCAPETEVIVDYDINDYLSKAELSASRLLTSVVVALRSYRDIESIRRNTQVDAELEAPGRLLLNQLGQALRPLADESLQQGQRLGQLNTSPMVTELINGLAANQRRLQNALILLDDQTQALARLDIIDVRSLLDELIQVFMPQARRQNRMLDYRLQDNLPPRLRLPSQGTLQLWQALMEYSLADGPTDLMLNLSYLQNDKQLKISLSNLSHEAGNTAAGHSFESYQSPQPPAMQQWRDYLLQQAGKLCLSLGGQMTPANQRSPGELIGCWLPAEAL